MQVGNSFSFDRGVLQKSFFVKNSQRWIEKRIKKMGMGMGEEATTRKKRRKSHLVRDWRFRNVSRGGLVLLLKTKKINVRENKKRKPFLKKKIVTKKIG